MPTPRVLRRTDDRNGERQMSLGEGQSNLLVPFLRMLARRDVLAGLLFIAVAALGLWLSRDYPIGTALRMGTGYVPRLLCWLLFGLGVVVLVQGLREAQDARALSSGGVSALRPLVFVTASLVIFGLGIERLGLGSSILLLIGGGARAAAVGDPGGGAGAHPPLLGHLHSRTGIDHPGLAGVVDGDSPQSRRRIRRGADAGEPILRARRRADRHLDRRSPRHRPD